MTRLNIHTMKKKTRRFIKAQVTGAPDRDKETGDMCAQLRLLEHLIDTLVHNLEASLTRLSELFDARRPLLGITVSPLGLPKVQLTCPDSIRFPVQPTFSTLSGPFHFSVFSAVAGHPVSATGTALRENLRAIEEFFYFVYKPRIQNSVIKPLRRCLELFKGPNNLSEKRYDKLLDVLSFSNDPEDAQPEATGGKQQESPELALATREYNALNAQLKSELPRFLQLMLETLSLCIERFLELRLALLYSEHIALFLICQLPSPHLRELEAEASTVAQVDRWIRSKQLGLFEHLDRTLACLHPLQQTGSERTSVFDASDGPAYSSTSLLSGSRRISSSSVAQTTTLQRPTTIINNASTALKLQSALQTEEHRSLLISNYSKKPDSLYTLSQDNPTSQSLDLPLRRGDLVAVLVPKDPSGNESRFFVDTGASKGFVDSRLLVPYNPSTAAAASQSPPMSPHTPLIDLSSSPEKSPPQSPFGFQTPRNSLSTPQLVDHTGYRQVSTPASLDPSMVYQAAFPFTAQLSNQLNLVYGEKLVVRQRTDQTGNTEWWCVENSAGRSGYVPANYLVPIGIH